MSVLRSLRVRLALATAAAVAVVVVVAGTALVQAASRDQYSILDDSLERRAALSTGPAQRAAESGQAPLLEAASGVLGGDFVARVMDGDELLYDSGGAATGSWPAVPAGYASVAVEGREWRTLRLPLGSSDLDLVVGVPLGPTRDTIETLRERALLVGAIAIGAAAVMGWLLGTWLLRPLRRLRSTAERVAETKDPSLRIPAAGGPPEVETVISSLNVMLERLDEAARGERDALATSRTFAANVAHELRTPLTSLRTDLDVLGRHPDLDRADRDALVVDAHGSATRMTELLSALEVLARGDLIGEVVHEAVDLSALVDAAVDAARSRHPDALIQVSQPDEAIEWSGWPEGLRVLVDNLLENAVVHGGDVREARVEVELEASSTCVVLTVTDDGPGIPAEMRDAVRAPFVRGAGTSAPGSGLGLAIVEQQAHLHGGWLQLEEGRSGGTRARIELPARHDEWL
jgi:two-component system, OmpR family, sensor histidine kinase PrrB